MNELSSSTATLEKLRLDLVGVCQALAGLQPCCTAMLGRHLGAPVVWWTLCLYPSKIKKKKNLVSIQFFH